MRFKASRKVIVRPCGKGWHRNGLGRLRWQIAGIFALSIMLPLSRGSAQADYSNTQAGRPLNLEDGYPLHRNALELYVAPVAASLSTARSTSWLVTPGFALGILPRTEAGLELPLRIQRDRRENRAGLSGVVLSALYGFNAETDRLPAFALRASTTIPAGKFAPDWRTTVRAIATRTMGSLRANVNIQYTYGDDPDSARYATGTQSSDGNRWLAGVAVDRAYSNRTILVGVETYAKQPLNGGTRTLFTGRVAVRKQLGPTFVIESGVGRQFNGSDAAWLISAGVSRSISVSGLLPGLGNWGG